MLNQTTFVADGLLRKRGTIWVLFFLLWLALGVLSAGFSSGLFFLVELPRLRRIASQPEWLGLTWRQFHSQLVIWLAWMALAPVALWLRRRWPLERGALKRALPAHLGAVILLCAAHSGVVLIAMWMFMYAGQPFTDQKLTGLLTYWWMRDLPFCALFYGLILGIGSALDYYRQFRERELRASQLEAQLAQAQLQMLKMQLHPHFLFNTLNGFAAPVSPTTSILPCYAKVGASLGASVIPPKRLLQNVVEDLLMEGRGAAAREAYNTLMAGYGAQADGAELLTRIAEVERRPAPAETVE